MRALKNGLMLALTLALAACSGLTARQEALLPAMKLAWAGVEADLSRGIEESLLAQRIEPTAADAQRQAVVRLGGGLAAGNPATVASVAWAPLAESARFGFDQRVSRNEISTGVAGSLSERIRLFGDGLVVFSERR